MKSHTPAAMQGINPHDPAEKTKEVELLLTGSVDRFNRAQSASLAFKRLLTNDLRDKMPLHISQIRKNLAEVNDSSLIEKNTNAVTLQWPIVNLQIFICQFINNPHRIGIDEEYLKDTLFTTEVENQLNLFFANADGISTLTADEKNMLYSILFHCNWQFNSEGERLKLARIYRQLNKPIQAYNELIPLVHRAPKEIRKQAVLEKIAMLLNSEYPNFDLTQSMQEVIKSLDNAVLSKEEQQEIVKCVRAKMAYPNFTTDMQDTIRDEGKNLKWPTEIVCDFIPRGEKIIAEEIKRQITIRDQETAKYKYGYHRHVLFRRFKHHVKTNHPKEARDEQRDNETINYIMKFASK